MLHSTQSHSRNPISFCSSRTGVVQTPQHCAPVYVRAVRSGKERPDKSHSEEKPTSLGAVRQPIKHLPLCLTDTSRSTSPHSACKNGGHINANASRIPTTRPSSGQNCPHVPTAIPLHNCSVMSYHAHPRARSRGFTRQGQSMCYCASCTATLARWKSLQMTKFPRPYLKFPLIEWSRTRPAVPVEVPRPTRPFLPRVAETAFSTTRTSSCRSQMEVGRLPTSQSL